MNTDLTGRQAIVCGASAGIGRACAAELASLGASVTVVSRTESKLRDVVASLPTPRAGQGQRHAVLACDLSKPDEARRAVEGWLGANGVCHVLVNNTGGPAPGPAASMTLDALRAGFDSLLATPHALTQAVVPGMKQAGFGRIINIASTSVKQPIPNLAVSNAIRAATANWAKTLSQELAGFGITVNNVLPGYTDTERLSEIFEMRASKAGGGADAVAKARADTIATIPAGRLGRPEEVAAAVGFLASPAAAYVSGINLPVDGGRLATL
ncbi:MAG: SDR family oxidoreductase [Phycisphaerales bacterium]